MKKNMGVRGQLLKKRKFCTQNLTKERKQPPVVILLYIFSAPMNKNHRNIRSRCLVHEYSFTDIFNDINHGYRAAVLKKNSLWLLPFYMVVATYFYYEKVRKTMRTTIVSNHQ